MPDDGVSMMVDYSASVLVQLAKPSIRAAPDDLRKKETNYSRLFSFFILFFSALHRYIQLRWH